MPRRHGFITLSVLLALAMSVLGCGESESGSAGEPTAQAAPSFGSIAFTTYRGGGEKIVFVTETRVKKTWRNMVGRAVNGTYEARGNEIVIDWDPSAKNHGSVQASYRQLGPCSMAFYRRVDKEGVVHDDFSRILEQKKPRCHQVTVTR